MTISSAMNQKGLVTGYALGILSSVAYGMNPLFGLHLYRDGMTPLNVLFYRFLFASIFLGAIMLIRKKNFRLPRLYWGFVAAGGVLLASSCWAWYQSFRIMDSGIGAAIMFVYPVMVAVIMTVGFHEKNSFTTAAGILLALTGVTVLSWPGTGAHVNLPGVIYVLLSSLTYAIYIVMVKVSRLKRVQPDTLTFYAMCVGTIFFLAIQKCGFSLQAIPSMQAFGNVLGIAFFPSLTAFLLMAVAIRYIGATRTAILGALEPVTAVCIGIFVFHEACTWQMILGILIVLAAVLLVVCRPAPLKNCSKSF